MRLNKVLHMIGQGWPEANSWFARHNKSHCYIACVFPATAYPFIVQGHMTSNNETVSCQMPWAGNIAKSMTSNGKQFIVTLEMLTAVARDRWNLSAAFKFCFCFVLLCNKSLNDWSLGEQWILFPSNLNKIHCSPRGQSLSVKCLLAFFLCIKPTPGVTILKPTLTSWRNSSC